MRPVMYTALNGVNAADASHTSAAIPSEFIFCFSLQTVSTGAPVGTVKIQVSNDASNPGTTGGSGAPQPTNWTDLASATSAVSAAATYLIPKTDLCYNWIRVVYTKTSGTGAITCNLKMLGA